MNMLQRPHIYLQGGDKNFEILMGEGNKVAQSPGRLHQAEGCAAAFYLLHGGSREISITTAAEGG